MAGRERISDHVAPIYVRDLFAAREKVDAEGPQIAGGAQLPKYRSRGLIVWHDAWRIIQLDA